MKKLVLMAIMFMLFMGIVSASSINGEYKGNPVVKLFFEGKEIQPNDVPAMIYDNRTMVPIYLLKKMGVTVTWDLDSYSVELKLPTKEVNKDENIVPTPTSTIAPTLSVILPTPTPVTNSLSVQIPTPTPISGGTITPTATPTPAPPVKDMTMCTNINSYYAALEAQTRDSYNARGLFDSGLLTQAINALESQRLSQLAANGC